MSGKKTHSATQSRPNAKKAKSEDSSSDPLTKYLKEISKIKPLTRSEEYRLSRQIKSGDIAALQELVKRNLKYVVTVANKYKGCGLSLQDLIEEGNIGLIQAAKRFDGAKQVKLITYADWWIRQAIMHALAEQAGTVKLPVKQAGMIYKLGRKYEDLRQVLDREPTREEVAEKMGISQEHIETMLRAYRAHLSLNTPLSDNKETIYLDLLENPNYIPYDKQILQTALKTKIRELLKDLTPREETILRMRFGFDGEPTTLEEIGKKVRLSRERVRQIEERAKTKLRLKSKSGSLRDLD
ncbi:MAG: RNA polymerase sigma factor RpoD/SigA [Nitrospinales bacterium]